MGYTFPQKYPKLAMGPPSSSSVIFWVKPKKDRLRVNCNAFFTWVGDGVGGPLGGDKAYRKLALKHHPDKMKRSMKVALKVLIFWKLAFLEALNVQRACSRQFFPVKIAPGFSGSPERLTGLLKVVFFWKKWAPEFTPYILSI